ncbi:uncharacterized protein MELLADRAFT_123241 [Melampsora larici-populina 98AG31]|uniref:Uncharacterized protein n=1 Tax=Melampsora larici-populina (strain 98AG31 / pathotype 3-4-7) TaxID=747676 RepID=F4RM33_MELLP|nr:uncharacterized protein MELLADRAFT_123241 [Melampsora larici-populina 98AG31]EGG06652.1 hypothetical protein MELLADRAFT_123241 [Melampsora larici-populina 98AG31]
MNMEKSLLERIGQAEENATRLTRAQSAALEKSKAEGQGVGGSGVSGQDQSQSHIQDQEGSATKENENSHITSKEGRTQDLKNLEQRELETSIDQQRQTEIENVVNQNRTQEGVDGIPFIQVTNADKSDDESWRPPMRNQKGKGWKESSPPSEEEEMSIIGSGSMESTLPHTECHTARGSSTVF